MEYTIDYTLTGKEKRNFFLYRYYFNTSPLFSFLRIIGGFAIIALGVWFLVNGTAFPVIFFTACLLYGLYYICRPFIVFFRRKEHFKDTAVSIKLDSKRMEYTEDMQTFHLDFSELIAVKQYKTFFVLQFKNKIMICIPKKALSAESIRILLDMKSFTG